MSRAPLVQSRSLQALLVAATCGLSALALSACGSSSPAASSSPSSPVTSALALCPLTGTPAPGGVVPARPALAVKVDNYSLGSAPAEARPQSGLDYADVIFEEQVEGSITRYAAVFQCQDAKGIVGPVRSARWTDVQMLSSLGHPILVHVGGIDQVMATIAASPLVNFDLGAHGSVETNPPGRYAPYDTYTTTQQVYAAAQQPAAAPAPLFTYSATAPAGTPASQVHLPWSGTSDIYWKWNATTSTWQRYYNVGSSSAPNIQPDLLADGVQNQAQNVIIQETAITYGPWVENADGGLEAESHILGNSGRAYILRNGEIINATWTASSSGTATVYTDAAGHVVALAPGRTWVEIYPQGGAVDVTPPPTTSTSAG